MYMLSSLLQKALAWIKNNKLTTVLILTVGYFLLFQNPVTLPQTMKRSANFDSVGLSVAEFAPAGRGGALPGNVAPRPDVKDRKVITNSTMSLQVANVRGVIQSINLKTKALGGYVVDTNITTPEFGESGTIVVRVPLETLDATLEYFRGLAVKVVSENISGTDITDQYIDIEERITRLEDTKTRFEQILDQAVEIDDILRVQREIFNLQDQIDRFKGQLAYMDGASSTTLITIYLSTDELGLPYTPSQAWRPEVVFKQAYRSLVLNVIEVANVGIWVTVYIPAIIFAFAVWIVVKRIIFKRKTPSQQ